MDFEYVTPALHKLGNSSLLSKKEYLPVVARSKFTNQHVIDQVNFRVTEKLKQHFVAEVVWHITSSTAACIKFVGSIMARYHFSKRTGNDSAKELEDFLSMPAIQPQSTRKRTAKSACEPQLKCQYVQQCIFEPQSHHV